MSHLALLFGKVCSFWISPQKLKPFQSKYFQSASAVLPLYCLLITCIIFLALRWYTSSMAIVPFIMVMNCTKPEIHEGRFAFFDLFVETSSPEHVCTFSIIADKSRNPHPLCLAAYYIPSGFVPTIIRHCICFLSSEGQVSSRARLKKTLQEI